MRHAAIRKDKYSYYVESRIPKAGALRFIGVMSVPIAVRASCNNRSGENYILECQCEL